MQVYYSPVSPSTNIINALILVLILALAPALTAVLILILTFLLAVISPLRITALFS
jgi:hypothetical protein